MLAQAMGKSAATTRVQKIEITSANVIQLLVTRQSFYITEPRAVDKRAAFITGWMDTV